MKRVSIYIRVSSTKQGEEGTSLETQEQSCRACAEQHGWQVVGVYREVHTGAELFERPQLTLLREAMRRKECDVLLVHALDRLSRKQTHQGLILTEAEHAGVEWHSVTEDINNSIEGQIMRAIIGGMAELERQKITERTMRGRKARAQAGRLLPGGTPRFGYRWRDAKKSAYEVDPETVPIVQRIFRELASGTPLRAVAARLTDDGIPTPKGGRGWRHSTIREMVKNPVYKGQASAFRHVTIKSQNGKRTDIRPDDEQIALPDGTAPALVDEGTWQEVQQRLARNRAESPRNNRDPEASLLRGGYVRCGYCGNTVIAFLHSSGWMYRCCEYSRDIPGCRSSSILVKHLDGPIWARVEETITDSRVVKDAVARMGSVETHASDSAELERKLAAIEQKRQRLVSAIEHLDDDADAALLLARLKELSAQKQRTVEERDRIRTQHAYEVQQRATMNSVNEWRQRVAANLKTLTYQEKRDVVAALNLKIELFSKSREEGPRWVATAAPTNIGFMDSTSTRSIP